MATPVFNYPLEMVWCPSCKAELKLRLELESGASFAKIVKLPERGGNRVEKKPESSPKLRKFKF